ncbi:MAG: hypothetical protein LBK41_01360 [Clostridiales bacterium]|nr:hypothetical protein [Clostridiales bacterium]
MRVHAKFGQAKFLDAIIAVQTGQQTSWTTQMTTQQNTFDVSQTERQTAWFA